MAESSYMIDSYGELILDRGEGDVHHHGEEDLALLYSNDDGTLYKHGRASLVETHLHKLTAFDPSITNIIIPLAELRGPKGPAILEVVNHTLACTGIANKLVERLDKIQQD